MSNSSKDQSLLIDDEHRVRESLALLLTEVGYDVCFGQPNEIPDESQDVRSVHKLVLTLRGSATIPPSGGLVERFPIAARSEKPLPAPKTPNRVTYQGTIYSICRSCYRLIGSGRAEASCAQPSRKSGRHSSRTYKLKEFHLNGLSEWFREIEAHRGTKSSFQR
jgi:hypothetical protein